MTGVCAADCSSVTGTSSQSFNLHLFGDVHQHNRPTPGTRWNRRQNLNIKPGKNRLIDQTASRGALWFVFLIYFSVTVAFTTITGLKMMKPNFELNRMWWNIADDDFDNRCIFKISVCALFMRMFQLLLKTTKALSQTCSGAVLLVRFTAVFKKTYLGYGHLNVFHFT